MIRTYFQMLLEEEIHGTEGKMKQFASWFTHGIPGGAALRKASMIRRPAPKYSPASNSSSNPGWRFVK